MFRKVLWIGVCVLLFVLLFLYLCIVLSWLVSYPTVLWQIFGCMKLMNHWINERNNVCVRAHARVYICIKHTRKYRTLADELTHNKWQGEYCLQRCEAVFTDTNLSIFWRNMLLLSSVSSRILHIPAMCLIHNLQTLTSSFPHANNSVCHFSQTTSHITVLEMENLTTSNFHKALI
jgi:hypothetical protein